MKKIIISSLFYIAATSAFANDVRIAFSKSENIEIFARNPDANDQWCADDIEINLSSANPAIDYNAPAVDQMIIKVGEAVIAKNCASAQRLTVYRGDNNLLLGVALKDSKWAMIRDGANEEDEPTGEEGDTSEVGETPAAVQNESNAAQNANLPINANVQQPADNNLALENIASLAKQDLELALKTGARDMPLSNTNIEQLNVYANKRADNYVAPPGADPNEEFVKILKQSIEEDMGYSFDLTYRRIQLFEHPSYTSILGSYFNPAERYIALNYDKAVTSGLISKRTFEILNKYNAGNTLNPEITEFLDHVRHCQKSNNGICNTGSLADIFSDRGVIEKQGKQIDYNIKYKIATEYNFGVMGNDGLIVKPDGSRANVNSMFDNRDNRFIVNENGVNEAIERQKIYDTQLEFFKKLAEQPLTLGKKIDKVMTEQVIGNSQAETPSNTVVDTGNSTAKPINSGKLMFWLVLLSALFVLIDAKRIGVKKGLLTGMGNMGAWSWFFGTLLLWIIVFPLYFFYRGKYKAALNPAKTSSQSVTDPTAEIEKLAALKEKGHITDAEFTARKKQLLGL